MLQQVSEPLQNISTHSPPRDQQKFLTVRDVAQRYSMDAQTVYELVASGEIPCLRIGTPKAKRPAIRIPLDALEAWENVQLEKQKGRAA